LRNLEIGLGEERLWDFSKNSDKKLALLPSGIPNAVFAIHWNIQTSAALQDSHRRPMNSAHSNSYIRPAIEKLFPCAEKVSEGLRLPSQELQRNPRVGALPTPPALLPTHTQRPFALCRILRLHLLRVPGHLSALVNDDV